VSWTEIHNERAAFTPAAPEQLPEGASYRDTPVEFHTPERWPVAPGRCVLDIPGRHWLARSPEECGDFSATGEWINEHVMVCRGCGLDAT
jgi:hypothetical protein